MNHADELEVAGEQAARLAGNFGQSTSDLSIRSIHLEQAARSLTMGSGRWASLASQAFFGAWSRAKQDSDKCVVGLIRATDVLSQAANTIGQYVPDIRDGLQAQQEKDSLPTSPQSPAEAHSHALIVEELNNSISQGQWATTALTQAIGQLANELEAAASQLGVCSTENPSQDAWDLFSYNKGADGVPPDESPGENLPADLGGGWIIVPLDNDPELDPVLSEAPKILLENDGFEFSLDSDGNLTIDWVPDEQPSKLVKNLPDLITRLEERGIAVQRISGVITYQLKEKYFMTDVQAEQTIARWNKAFSKYGFHFSYERIDDRTTTGRVEILMTKIP